MDHHYLFCFRRAGRRTGHHHRYIYCMQPNKCKKKKVTDREVGPTTSPTLTSLVNQAASSPGKAVHSLHACIHAWLSCIRRLSHSCMQSKWKKCCRWLRLWRKACRRPLVWPARVTVLQQQVTSWCSVVSRNINWRGAHGAHQECSAW